MTGVRLDAATLRGSDPSRLLHDCTGCDLRALSLSGADLRGAHLIGADLAGANLRGAAVGGATLFGVSFRRADLDGVDFAGARLCTRDDQARVRCPDIRDASLRGVVFDGALLCASRYSQACRPMTSADFLRYVKTGSE